MNLYNYKEEELREKNQRYIKVITKLLNAIDFTLKENHDLFEELNQEIDIEIYNHNNEWIIMNLKNVMEINSKKLEKQKGK
jgi:hypothetical protein